MKKILDNLWLKVTAVVLGLLIWLHVATDKHYTYELYLPVTEVALNDSLTLAARPPESLLVSVSGTGKQLLRKKWRDRGLRINASHLRIGDHQITLGTDNTTLAGASGIVMLDEVLAPTQIMLQVDQTIEKKTPVVGNFLVEPADGFAIATPVKVRPDSVTVRGPKTVLADINQLTTEQKRLSAVRADVSLVLPVVLPPMYGLSVRPDSVSLLLTVVPVKTRIFEHIPVRIFNLPPDSHFVAAPPTVTLALTGPPEDIDMLAATAITASADYRKGLNAGGKVPVRVDFPPAFRLKEISADSIRMIRPQDVNSGH
jgi:YbbR domain-containing protein